MDCMPEISVSRRKTLSISKAAKRLRRFVRDNQSPVAVAEPSAPEYASRSSSAELVCSVPDETLFQLEQIYEDLEAKSSRRATIAALPSTTLSSPQVDAEPMETPKKSSKKRSREEPDEPPVTDVKEPARVLDDKHAKKRKKARRKSTAT